MVKNYNTKKSLLLIRRETATTVSFLYVLAWTKHTHNKTQQAARKAQVCGIRVRELRR